MQRFRGGSLVYDPACIKSDVLGGKEKIWLMKFLSTGKLDLLFKGTANGMNANAFHNKCDGVANTVTIIKRETKGNNGECNGTFIFGMYNPMPWSSTGGLQLVNGAFMFCLKTDVEDVNPIKFNLVDANQPAVYYDATCGPCFGASDISLGMNFETDFCCNFPVSFDDKSNVGGRLFGGNACIVTEVEVFAKQ